MRKVGYLLAVGTMLGAGWWMYSSTRPFQPTRADLDLPTKGGVNGRKSVSLNGRGVSLAKAADQSAKPPQVGTAQVEQPVSSAEESMLAMYDEIAIELDAEHRDCEIAAEALRRAISDHSSEVKQWVMEQRALPVAERKTEQAHSADGARMQAARKALNASLERCAGNAQFVSAFQQLGALSSDS